MAEPTPAMQAQMKTHLRYLQLCVGWTGDQCRQLAADYKEAMQCKDGFTHIEAHLASVVPGELAALERRERKAA